MPRRHDPDGMRVVYRTARVGLRVTCDQQERCFGLMRSAGDVWACVLEVNAWRRQRHDRPLVGYQHLCRESAAAGAGTFGELDTVGARSVLRRFSDAWFSAAKRRKAGESEVRFPRRRRHLMPVRWYCDGDHPPVRGGWPGWCGTVGVRAGDPCRAPDALGRHQSPAQGYRRRAPKPGQRGSRRWRKTRRRGRQVEGRHRRRIQQTQHEAARMVIDWAVGHRVGTLTVGDPRGVLDQDAGRRHNLRLRQWQIGRTIQVLIDKAQVAGITVHLVDERGTSSTCPACLRRVPKPKGRVLICPHCDYFGPP